MPKRLGGLTFQRADLPTDFGDHIDHAHQIGVGQRELLQGLLALGFILGNASRLLKHRAPFLGLGGKDLVDLSLSHDRVTGPANTGVHEQLLNVFEAAGLAVEEILAPAVAMDPAHDFDLVKFAAELFFAVGQQQRDLAHLRGLTGIRALENHVLHLAAAQRLGGLLAEHPTNGVGHIGFTAAIGPYDGGHAGLEAQGGGIGERLETVKFERFEIHAVSRGR